MIAKLKNLYGFWKLDSTENPVLKDISITIEQGNLYGVIGKIDSGKSSLL